MRDAQVGKVPSELWSERRAVIGLGTRRDVRQASRPPELRIGVQSGNPAARSLYRLAGFLPHLEILIKR